MENLKFVHIQIYCINTVWLLTHLTTAGNRRVYWLWDREEEQLWDHRREYRTGLQHGRIIILNLIDFSVWSWVIHLTFLVLQLFFFFFFNLVNRWKKHLLALPSSLVTMCLKSDKSIMQDEAHSFISLSWEIFHANITYFVSIKDDEANLPSDF